MAEPLEDRQANIADLLKSAQEILDNLINAEACESENNFIANLNAALSECRGLAKEIEDAL